MPDAARVIGQALYTWSLRNERGTPGFGFAAASPAAERLLDRLDRVADAKSYPALQQDGLPLDSVRDQAIPVRQVLGELAIVVSKTYQGNDANGRAGRYCNQIFVGPRATLTVSSSLALRSKHLIKPASAEMAGFQTPRLADLAPSELLEPRALTADWDSVAPIIHRLDAADWRAVSLGRDDLSALPLLMNILGQSWDEGSTLAATATSTELRWRLTLSAVEPQSTSQDIAQVEAGDARWSDAKARLAGARSTDELAAQWRAAELPEAATELSSDEREQIVQDATYDFTRGDGTYLMLLFEGTPFISPVTEFEALDALVELNLQLPTRSVFVDQINGLLLAAASSADWTSQKRLGDILPDDRQDIARVARTCLTPEVFHEIAVRNSTASDRDLIRISHPQVSLELWDALAEAWKEGTKARLGVVRTLAGSGAEPGGIIRTLIAADTSQVPSDLLFRMILPEVFEPREARLILEDCEDIFLEWSGLSPYYLEALHRGGGFFAWLGRPRRKRGND